MITRSLYVEQAIVDAIGRAMTAGHGGGSAEDLIAVLLQHDRTDGGTGLRSVPIQEVLAPADAAAQREGRITNIADLVATIIERCAEELNRTPQVLAALRSLREEARKEPRYANPREEARARLWRLETTYRSGEKESQYFRTFTDANRAQAGITPAGPHVETSFGHSPYDAVVSQRIVAPGED